MKFSRRYSLSPRENEVLIEVAAVSLNFRDKAIVDGIYEPETIPKPLIPVSDAVGVVVVAAGPGVTHLREGDRVNSHLYSAWVDGDPKPNEPDFCYGGVINADSEVQTYRQRLHNKSRTPRRLV